MVGGDPNAVTEDSVRGTFYQRAKGDIMSLLWNTAIAVAKEVPRLYFEPILAFWRWLGKKRKK